MIGFGAPIAFLGFGTGSTNILGYDGTTPGSAVANTAFSADGIVGFGFGRGVFGSTQLTVNTYTAAANLGDANSPAGSISGFAPVTFNIATMTNGATFTADTSAWFANYNGTDFNQGSGRNLVDGAADGSFATGTLSGCSGITCSYTLNWSSYIVGGAFDGNTGVWNITGCFPALTGDCPPPPPPIPEASTYAMMLAGLSLVGGMAARRRKQAKA